MVSSELRSFAGCWPPYHQAGAGYDAVLIGMDDSTIHRRTLAEIIGIHNQVSLSGHVSQPQIVQQFCQYGLGLEIFFGDIFGSAAVSFVIAFDRFESSQDFVHRVKREQPLTCWKDRLEASVLRDYRSAGSAVAGTAITEPSSFQAPVRVLGPTPFPASTPHKLPLR